MLFEQFVAPRGVHPNIVQGTVGWDDEEEYAYFGSDADDGYTFVRVQLNSDRNGTRGTPDAQNKGEGVKLICHISSGILRVPKPGTRVMVAIESGQENVPGAGVIFAVIEKTAGTQLNKDRVVLDFGDDVHVVIRGMSVSMQSTANEFISVGTPRSGGTPGLIFQAADGSGGVVQEGVVGWFVAKNGSASSIIQMTPDAVECTHTQGGYWKIDKDFYCLGSSAYIVGGAVYLGPHCTALTPGLYGATGIAGVASTSVFFSP